MSMRLHYRLQHPVALDIALELRGFTVLFGRSGSGKTSLLKAIAGLLPAQGEPWHGLPPQRRPVGYLPQGCALFPHLRVWQNVAFALDGPQAARRAQAMQLLDNLGLAALAERWPGEISGGQQQRVALARALAHQPQLLLLDEPTSTLDVVTREEVMGDLLEGIRRSGVPALVASHDLQLATLADHVALLVDGRVIQHGTPEQLLGQPASATAARLLGMRNVYVATVLASADGQLTLDCQGLRLHALGASSVGAQVGVAIPVEAMSLATAGDGQPLAVVRLRREGFFLRLWLQGAGTPLVETLQLRLGAEPGLGEHLWVQAAPTHVHVFPLTAANGLPA